MIIDFSHKSGGGMTPEQVQGMITSSLTPYYTSAQTDTAIDTAVSGKADTTALTSYTTTAYTKDLELSVAGNLNLKENLGNKVVTITSGSTDIQYPSAKAVYTAIQQGGGGGGVTPQQVQEMIASATTDMATQTWVGQQGYLTQHQDISMKADSTAVTSEIATAVADMATKTWVEGKGYITGITSTDVTTALSYTPCQTVALTQEEYNDLPVKDNNTIYGIIS